MGELNPNGLNFVNKESLMYDANINTYNSFIRNLFDDAKDLIQMHYITEREDTQFWKYCKYEMKRTDKANEILEICKYRSPCSLDWDTFPGASGWGVWATILTGLGILNKRVIHDNMWNHNYMVDSEIMYEKMVSHFLNYKKYFITHNQLIDFIKEQK